MIPKITVTTVIQQHVTCEECGPLVIVPDALKARAFEYQREHLAMHKRKESPISEILDRWEALQSIEQRAIRPVKPSNSTRRSRR